MLNWLEELGEFLASVFGFLFGESLDSGLGIAVAAYTGLVAICFAIGSIRAIAELTKAVDVGFSKTKLEDYNLQRPDGTPPRAINWALARQQQVRSVLFSIPLGVVVMATLIFWARDFSLRGYVIIAVCWIVGLMMIRPWWIWTALRSHRKLVKTGTVEPEEAQLHDTRLVWAMQHYFRWGLQQKTAPKRSTFIGILRFINPIVGIFRLQWLRIRLVWPLVICAFNASLWIFTLPVAVFHLTREFDERLQPLRPRWVGEDAPEPTYGTGAGDAAASSDSDE